MADGGGGEGAEGGRSAVDLNPIYERVEAMVGKSQAREEALAADSARLDRAHRGSLEAARRLRRSVEELQSAAREKDAEMERLRAEAADARKKLQADTGKGARWEAAYLDLLLGANQKLVELRDADMEDSRTLAEPPNSKETESCTKLNGKTVDHISSDLSAELRKLKQAYETLSSKKDDEVSALLSEKYTMRSQLDKMQQDYAELIKNKKVEAAQATEAATKLQKMVDELKVLARKKDDEIVRLRAEAVDAKKKIIKMQSLVKEKHGEIQRLEGLHLESIQKLNKDISQTHKNFRSDGPAVWRKSKNNRQMVEDYISQTETIGKDWQDEPRQKRRRVSFISNDDEKTGSDEEDDGQSGSDEEDDEHNGSDEDGDEQNGNDSDGEDQSRSDEDSDGQSRRDEYDEDEQSGHNEETMNDPVQNSLGIPKRKREACNARFANGKATVKAIDRTKWYWYPMAPAPLCSQKLQILDGRYFVMSTGNWAQFIRDVKDIVADQPEKRKEFIRFLCDFENWRIEDVARTMAVLLDGHPELICRFNRFLPMYWQIQIEEREDEEVHPDESAIAAAGLIKLKEAEEQPSRERV